MSIRDTVNLFKQNPIEDFDNINDMGDLSDEIKNNIHWFFSNYKNKTSGKWSKVIGYLDKEESIKLFEKYNL